MSIHALLNLELYRLDVKSQGTFGLWRAVYNGEHKRASLFLDAGAYTEASAQDPRKSHLNPLIAAVFRRRPEMIKLLAERGANLDQVGSDGYTTPLLHPIEQTHSLDGETGEEGRELVLGTLQALLDGGADIKLVTFRPGSDVPWSYLQVAMHRTDDERVLPLLMRYGADVREVFVTGRSR